MKCPITASMIFIKSQKIVVLAILLGLIIYVFNLNQALFYRINSWHIFLPNKVWEILNLLSYAKFAILPVLLCILTFVWRRDKISKVIILVIVYYGVFYLLKVSIGEARPYMILPQDSFFYLNNGENAIKSAYKSFPSGHTGNAAVFVFALMELFCDKHKVIKILLFLFLIMVALSRICSGWHWPLDVLSSMIIGYILVKVCLYNKTTSFNKIS